MASPYFSNINVQQADYSPLVQAGAAIGNMYSNLGATFANTITEVGNAYFEEKKAANAVSDFLKRPEGQQYLQEQYGYTPEQVSDMMEKGTLPKEIQKVMKDIGVEKIMERQRTKMATQQAKESHEALMTQYRQKEEQYDLLQNKTNRLKEISSYYYRPNQQGAPSMNLDGYDKLSEYGAEIAEFAQENNIAGFSQGTFASFLQQNKTGNIDLTNKESLLAVADQYNAATGASSENAKRNQDYALQSFINPDDVSKTARNKIIETDPFNKRLFEAKQSFDLLREKSKNYFITDETGRVTTITNPVGIADFRRSLAKNGNGVGVMTDKDVDDYRGETDVASEFARFMQKWFAAAGDDATDEQVASALSNEDATYLLEHANVIGAWHDNRLGEVVRSGVESTHKSYPALTRQKVIELSGYENYLNYDSSGEMTRAGELSMQSQTIEVGGSPVSIFSPKVQTGVQRMIKDGMSMQEIETKFQQANPNEPVDKIRNMVRSSIEQKQKRKEGQEGEASKELQTFIDEEVLRLKQDGETLPTRLAMSGGGGLLASNVVSGIKGMTAAGLSRLMGGTKAQKKQAEDMVRKAIAKEFSAQASGQATTSQKAVGALKTAAKKIGIKPADLVNVSDDEVVKKMKKKLMNEATTSSKKSLVKRFLSPKKLAGSGAVGMVLFLSDIFGLVKATDGMIEEDEIKGIIADAKRKYPDIPDKELVDIRKSLLNDIYVRKNKAKGDRYYFGRQR